MDTRRKQTLQEMGIDVWQRRGLDVVAADGEAPAAGNEAAAAITTGATMIDNGLPTDAAPAAPATMTKEPTDVARRTAASNDDHACRVAAMGWGDLEAIVHDCRRCGLHETRTQTVFGVGNRKAEWLIVGEAPGADEDRQGEPFVGRAGRLLNSMLLAIGLPREQVFICNILKCRPPGNRDPKPEEEQACRDYLERQIRLVRPKIILAVGRIAAQNLMKVDTPIGKMRGHKYTYQDTGIPVVITYHPAYLLRSPLEKRKAWGDLLYAKKVFAGLA